MWSRYLAIVGRLSYFSSYAYSRLSMSDTDKSKITNDVYIDMILLSQFFKVQLFLFFFFFLFLLLHSYLISTQRQRTGLEKHELRELLKKNKRIPFHESLIARNLSQVYIKTLAPVLDWSCLNSNSFVYKTLIEHDSSLSAQFEFLSQATHSQSYLLKDEANNQLLKAFVASSAKQYIIETHPTDTEFPILSYQSETLALKCKGVQRNRHRHVTYSDFCNVAIRNKPSKTFPTSSLKRSNHSIYLLKGTKKKLSKYSVKRLYSEAYRRNLSFYSFPLNWKKIIY